MLPNDEYLGLRAAETFMAGTIAAIEADNYHPANLPSAIHVIKGLVEPATDRECYRLAHERLEEALKKYGDIPDKEITNAHVWEISDQLILALREFRSLEI